MSENQPDQTAEELLAIRAMLQACVLKLRGADGKPKSREQELAVTRIQEARFWLGEAIVQDQIVQDQIVQSQSS